MPGAGVRAHEVRAALERALAAVEADERVAALIAANELRIRFEFTDSELSLDLDVAERGAALRWSAESEAGWRPQFTLAMSSEVANATCRVARVSRSRSRAARSGSAEIRGPRCAACRRLD